MKTSSTLSSSTNETSAPSNLNEGGHNLSSSTASRTRRASRPSMPVPEPLLSPESSSVETSPLVDKGNEFAAPTLVRSLGARSEDENEILERQFSERFDEYREEYGDEEEEEEELEEKKVKALEEDEEDASALGEARTVVGEETSQMEPAEFEVMSARQELDMIEKYTYGRGHVLKMVDASARLETLYRGLPPNPAFELPSFKTVRRLALTLAADVGRFEEDYILLGEALPGPQSWDRRNEEYRSWFEMNASRDTAVKHLKLANSQIERAIEEIERLSTELATVKANYASLQARSD